MALNVNALHYQSIKCRLQTKAAYVLFYQRRDISANCKREPSSSPSAAAAGAVCNGNGAPATAAAATAKEWIH